MYSNEDLDSKTSSRDPDNVTRQERIKAAIVKAE